MSPAEGFDAMRKFLEAYWDSGGRMSEDLAVLLSSLNRDEITQSPPLDLALWDDWLDAVKEVTSLNERRQEGPTTSPP